MTDKNKVRIKLLEGFVFKLYNKTEGLTDENLADLLETLEYEVYQVTQP